MDVLASPALYYRHSGKFFMSGIFVTIIFGLAVGLPCAWLYAWLIHWNPIIYINILAALGFGAAIGIVMERSLESRKCRNVPVTGVSVLAVVVVAYYVSWGVWLHALTQVSTMAVLPRPGAMWQLILYVNEVGAWSLHGDVVKGIPLWICWAIEAASIVGLAVYIAVHTMQEATYCEGCDHFAKATKGVYFAGTGTVPLIEDKAAFKSYRKGLKPQAAELKQHLEIKDFTYIEDLGKMQPDAPAWYQFDLTSCPQCNMTNTLAVTQFQRSLESKKSKQKNTQHNVLRQLLLSSTEADSLRKLNGKSDQAKVGTASGLAY